jgi:ElaB/YqjD/DUF883 family membrane-anchored ribosome-binding protein
MRTKSGNGHSVDLDQFMEDLKVVVKDGQELLRAGVSTAKSQAVASARTTDQAVRQNPYQTMAIVFGAGLLIGILSSGILGGGSHEDEEED